MGTIQKIGTDMDLKGGDTQKMDTFEAGSIGMVGDDVSMPRTNTPFGVFTEQNMGVVQLIGDDCGKLKRTPHRGYESGTPINAQEELPDTKESY